MSRPLDNRRVRDVQAKPAPGLADFADDPELASYGYSGEIKTYRLRIQRIHELDVYDRGPLAEHRRFMAELGYRSPWRPYYPPGTAPLEAHEREPAP